MTATAEVSRRTAAKRASAVVLIPWEGDPAPGSVYAHTLAALYALEVGATPTFTTTLTAPADAPTPIYDDLIREAAERGQVETWATIPGTHGWYDVSNLGRVRSWYGKLGRQRAEPLMRKLWTSTTGYPNVVINIDGKPHTRAVHRLIMEAFIGPRPEGYEVRHLDGDQKNSVLGNLAYGTKSQNRLDAIRHGTHYQSSKTQCPRNHGEYDGISPSKGRYCKTCHRESAAALRAKKRAYIAELERRLGEKP